MSGLAVQAGPVHVPGGGAIEKGEMVDRISGSAHGGLVSWTPKLCSPLHVPQARHSWAVPS